MKYPVNSRSWCATSECTVERWGTDVTLKPYLISLCWSRHISYVLFDLSLLFLRTFEMICFFCFFFFKKGCNWFMNLNPASHVCWWQRLSHVWSGMTYCSFGWQEWSWWELSSQGQFHFHMFIFMAWFETPKLVNFTGKITVSTLIFNLVKWPFCSSKWLVRIVMLNSFRGEKCQKH